MIINLFGIPVNVDLRGIADFIERCNEISNDETYREEERKEAARVADAIRTYKSIEEAKIIEERKQLYNAMTGKNIKKKK